MELLRSIQQYSSQPIPHQVMTSLLREYSQPNDKIHHLIRDGVLQQIKRGLYVAGPKITSAKPDPFLIANHLLGPSYVSLESALSYHGLIPEKVYEVSSVTMKAKRRFSTPLGVYSYTRLPMPYYSYGIRGVEIDKQHRFLIASPEKALLDKIITTAGVEFRSKTSVLIYMENDLRIDMDALKKLDWSVIESWIPTSPKKDTLSMLTKTIRQYILPHPTASPKKCIPCYFANDRSMRPLPQPMTKFVSYKYDHNSRKHDIQGVHFG